MELLAFPSNDPAFNLAAEEYLTTTLPNDCSRLFLWQNRPAVIVGRFQYAYDELSLDYIAKHRLPVLRRMTGGGAVYHDMGNINFSFIINENSSPSASFTELANPIIKALQALALPVKAGGRNDLYLYGRKFSGTAQLITDGKLLYHGTLLYDSDLTVLNKVLTRRHKSYRPQATESIPAKVINLRPFIPAAPAVSWFCDYLTNSLPVDKQLVLNEEQLFQIEQLAAQKYRTDSWNFNDELETTHTAIQHFPFGSVELHFSLADNKITDCQIFGDFFINNDLSKLSDFLLGTACSASALQKQITPAILAEFLPQMSSTELINLFLSAIADN